jgi:predicted transcriptional regulator
VKRNEARKPKSRMVSFRVDEDYLARLDALVQQTSYSRAEVLRRCLVGDSLKSTIDAQALTEVARVHADLNRIGGLLKLAIRGPRSTKRRAASFPGLNRSDTQSSS